ncbi:Alpha/Beta hydrolase protein [Talaromyces proteolyticus]|uniref:Alpha/Beta hydrolase protein n=1 Tax=Talaromyces proteolyticus TaxID=1131652 RepID=A0AAD4L0Y5_9EURO|nr:Alpha/Beta hydrolase protein [Talaromyces proteolyticus]KAH8703500.1 Alpha/Beta hydrolase protein [Talaromyces proteolyticus]
MSFRNRIARQEPLPIDQAKQFSLGKMEPNFSPRAGTPHSSRTELIIGGLRTYVYGIEEIEKAGYQDVAVLYLAHGRTRTYRDMEMTAYEILHQYRNTQGQKKAGLIAVAFDMRNHGERVVTPKSNQAWTNGNVTHAQDMIGAVSGSAQDIELLINYLPTYLPQFDKFYNVVSGVSLGGHTSWRVGTDANSKLQGLAIVIGSPNLTGLLLSRLGVKIGELSVPEDELYTVPYDKLSPVLTEEQRRRWPRALSELIAELDRNTAEKFPRNVPTYILNGKLDPLVPDRFTKAWVAKRRDEGYANIDYFVQENTGHTCTDVMVDNIAQWLVKLFSI